jgi:hypothetical protein
MAHAVAFDYLLDHEGGRPLRWLAMIRRSLRDLGPRINATRTLREDAKDVYPHPPNRRIATDGDPTHN